MSIDVYDGQRKITEADYEPPPCLNCPKHALCKELLLACYTYAAYSKSRNRSVATLINEPLLALHSVWNTIYEDHDEKKERHPTGFEPDRTREQPPFSMAQGADGSDQERATLSGAPQAHLKG